MEIHFAFKDIEAEREKSIMRFYYWGSLIISLTLLCCVCFSSCGVTPARAEGIDMTSAVIHHSASPDVSAKTIDRWHKERGWSGIGYHFVIRANGTIEKGRPLNKIGAHAKGRNNYVGICLTGYNHFTKAQVKSLITLLNDLGINHIEAHHQQCPGPGLDMQYVKNHIKPINTMIGKASNYTDRQTANGEKFDSQKLTCATLTGNYGMRFKVTNLNNGQSIVVRNNDLGPFKPGRIIDLTPTAFKQLAPLNQGIINVRVEAINGGGKCLRWI